MTFLHAIGPLLALTLLGPVCAVALARMTGGITWTRVLLWAVVCQVIVVLIYLHLRSVPIMVYGSERMPSAAEFRAAEQELAIVVIVLGVLVAALMTPVARWLARN